MSIIVEYDVHKDRQHDFIVLMKEHARRTLFEEDGCLRFEILQPQDNDGVPAVGRLLVSELYVDKSAVDAHNGNPRLAALRETIHPLVKSQRLILSAVVGSEPDDGGMMPDELNAANDG